MFLRIELALCLFTTLSFANVGDAPITTFDPGHVTFLTQLNGDDSPLRTRSVFLLPEEELELVSSESFRLRSDEEFVSRWGKKAIWTAPSEPGIYTLDMVTDEAPVRVNVFVLIPYSKMKKGKVEGYKIGNYPKGDGAYARPKGFVRVTKEDADTWVSPHFQLKQFLCKQAGGYPKFLVLQERLLTKLELTLTRLNEKGVYAPTFEVMSGFRSPSHNRSLRNSKRAQLSRHMYGDAADILLDAFPKDGRMDDLNGDGRLDAKDSSILQSVVNELELENDPIFPIGGIGLYKNTRTHGPFVHLDARGHEARWGIKPVL